MNVIRCTFFEGLVNTGLSISKAFVSFNVREHSALVDPVVVVRAEEEHGEVAQVVLEALDVERHRPGIADLSRPPSESGRMESHTKLYMASGSQKTLVLYFVIFIASLRTQNTSLIFNPAQTTCHLTTY